MNIEDESVDGIELDARQLGLTDEEVRLAQEVGFTLEEMHKLKNYKRRP